MHVLGSSGLFFTNIYNSIVNAANWESNIPHSILATKDFFMVANPGTFFKMVDPTNLILIVLALILFWKKSTFIRSFTSAFLKGFSQSQDFIYRAFKC